MEIDLREAGDVGADKKFARCGCRLHITCVVLSSSSSCCSSSSSSCRFSPSTRPLSSFLIPLQVGKIRSLAKAADEYAVSNGQHDLHTYMERADER
jgi:hypothetical protein